jgi:hypothetical protein
MLCPSIRLFEMEVKDVFAFEDGTVVFTGPIETHTKFIGLHVGYEGQIQAEKALIDLATIT